LNNNIRRVKEWILDRRPGLGDIDPDIDLIENRLIDSLVFVELILFLEEMSGSRIDMSALTPDYFKSLRAIDEHFLRLGDS